MWNTVKSYVHFCGLALKENLPSGRVKLIRIAWLILAFLLGWIINAFFGINLKDVAKAIYYLLPWYGWVFTLLGFAICFSLFIIDGARRFYERTVREINAEHITIMGEHVSCAKKLHASSMAYGMAYTVYNLPDIDQATTIPVDGIKYIDASIHQNIQNFFSREDLKAYLEGLQPVSGDANTQKMRAESQMYRLERLSLEQQRAISSKDKIQKR